MKKGFVCLLVLILIPTFSGCTAFINGFKEGLTEGLERRGSTGEVQTVKSSESSLSLEFPGSWRSKELNDNASVEMARETKEQYLIVIEEPRIDFEDDMTLDDYTSIIMENMLGTVSGANEPALVNANIGNNISARQFELSGSVEKIKVKFLVTCTEVNDIFYQFVTWSIQSKFDEAKPVFDEILSSVSF